MVNGIYGEWQANNISISIDEKIGLSWTLRDLVSVHKNEEFQIEEFSSDYCRLILAKQESDVHVQYDFYKLSDSQMMVMSFKPWIAENRFDEFMLLTRKGSTSSKTSKPFYQEEIVLPDNLCGSF